MVRALLQTCRFIVEDELRRGDLVEVLQRYGGRSRPFSIIYPASRHMSLRVRVFLGCLVECARGP